MLITSLNRIAVISWIQSRGGRASIARGGVMVLGKMSRLAYVGDWIVRYPQGEFCVVPNRMFSMLYVPQEPIRRIK